MGSYIMVKVTVGRPLSYMGSFEKGSREFKRVTKLPHEGIEYMQ